MRSISARSPKVRCQLCVRRCHVLLERLEWVEWVVLSRECYARHQVYKGTSSFSCQNSLFLLADGTRTFLAARFAFVRLLLPVVECQ
jgi:hypothetical protein